MALVVEDGTGVAGANAYADVAYADAWFVSLNDSEWAALATADKRRDMIIGAQYVSNQQIYPYSGSKAVYGQAMAWPRIEARYFPSGPDVPEAGIPPEVVAANMVAAKLSSQGLLPTQIYTDRLGVNGGQEIKRERVEGAITVDYFHSKEGQSKRPALGAGALDQLGHPAVTGLILPLLREEYLVSTGGSVPRSVAARRGGAYQPDPAGPPAFGRGMFDRINRAEDAILATRAPAGRYGD